MSKFALQLNMIDKHLKKKLPPTDSRLRPDQRYLEEGDIKLANDEKRRLEDKQRRRMRRMKEDNIEFVPRYFVRDDHEEDANSNFVSYKYLRNYWKDRQRKNWDGMPDLFGEDSE